MVVMVARLAWVAWVAWLVGLVGLGGSASPAGQEGLRTYVCPPWVVPLSQTVRSIPAYAITYATVFLKLPYYILLLKSL